MLGLLIVWCFEARAQSNEASPGELIRYLTYQADRPAQAGVLAGLFGCGQVDEDRSKTKALIAFGFSAVSELERAFDSIVALGESSPFAVNAGRLLEAYAAIRGEAAFDRLSRIGANPSLGFLRRSADQAIAVALKLTSYVSETRPVVREFRCDRMTEPRDVLDRFILGLERGDRLLVEESLSPAVKTSLTSLLETTDRRGVDAKTSIAVGYRFEAPTGEARKPDTEPSADDAGALRRSKRLEMHVTFSDASGRECSKSVVGFLAFEEDNSMAPNYLLDSPDVAALSRTISMCFGASAAGRR